MGVILSFFPSSGTSPSIHNYSDITDSSLPMLSGSSLNTLRGSMWGLIDHWRSSCCHRSHTNSSLPDSGFRCASAWGSVPKAWGPTVLVKTELEKVLRTFAFSVSLVTNSPLLFNTRPVFPSSLLLVFTYLKYPSMWFLISLANFNLNRGSGFLTAPLHALGVAW